jgi:elongation factor 2
MQYTAEEIQKRFVDIITNFNNLIQAIAEKQYKEEWKVNIQDGSVMFGSARDNWALSLPYMKKYDVKMEVVYEAYKLPKDEREKIFWEKCAVHEVILDAVVKHLPTPEEAQKYRIPHIWKGDLESEFGKDLLTCNPKGEVGFVITRIIFDPRAGREISAGRLFSGTITNGMQVYLNGAKRNQRVQQVFMYAGIKTEIFESVSAGNCLALAGMDSFAGETITTEPQQEFEELKHIFEPVISKSIKPAVPQDLSKLIEVLRKVGKEDPSITIEINQETGETVLHGMGELHLEIIEGRITSEKGVKILTGPPIIVYRETIAKKNPTSIEGKSPNKHNKLYFQVEPLEPEVWMAIKNKEIHEGRIKKKDMEMRDKLVAMGYTSDQAFQIKDIYNQNIFVDATKGNIQLAETIELVVAGFRQVCDEGPLAREPCIGMKVTLVDAKLHEDAIHRGPAQIYPTVREGLKGAMMQAAPVLFEPMQTHLIEAPVDFTGEVTKLVMNKRGQVLEMNEEGALAFVKAKMPVGEMIGWSSDLRSATGGRGTSSLWDQEFQKVPGELQKKIIQQIVSRKGLTAGQLGA